MLATDSGQTLINCVSGMEIYSNKTQHDQCLTACSWYRDAEELSKHLLGRSKEEFVLNMSSGAACRGSVSQIFDICDGKT